ncbi:MAG: nucleotidyltransferase family protein [bacterium]
MDYQPYIDRLKRLKNEEKRQRAARRKRALKAADQIASRLRNDFGAEHIYLFGSTLLQDYFYLHSDIDIAVRGIAPEKFLRALYEVNDMDHGFRVDLVDLPTSDDFLKRRISDQGQEL